MDRMEWADKILKKYYKDHYYSKEPEEPSVDTNPTRQWFKDWKKHWEEINKDNICPSCSIPMRKHEGYYKCAVCGYGKLIVDPYEIPLLRYSLK